MRRNNKKKKLAKMLLILIIIIAVGLLITLNYINDQKGPVIAKVNGEKIYKSEIDFRLKEMFHDTNPERFQLEKLPKEIVESLAKDVYAQKKIDKKIKKMKLIKDPEIKEKIDEYTKMITRKKYLELRIKERINDKTIKDKYIELTGDLSGKKEIHLKHILLNSKADAENILKQLKAKKSFADLAKKYSKDQETADKGGDLGFVFEDNLTPEFVEFVEEAKSGNISKPIQTKYGWHIIQIEEIRDAKAPPFETVKPIIEEQMKKEEVQKIFSDITDSAKVKIMIKIEPIANSEIKNLPQNQPNQGQNLESSPEILPVKEN